MGKELVACQVASTGDVSEYQTCESVSLFVAALGGGSSSKIPSIFCMMRNNGRLRPPVSGGHLSWRQLSFVQSGRQRVDPAFLAQQDLESLSQKLIMLGARNLDVFRLVAVAGMQCGCALCIIFMAGIT